MRVMIVNGGFYPAQNLGGPVVSIDNFMNLLKENEYYIVTRDHDWKSSERLAGITDGWNRYSNNCYVIYLRDNEHSVKRYREIIREIKPELIYINGFYLAQMYIPFFYAARKEKVPVLDAPRGTLCKNAMAIKSIKKYAYVTFMSLFLEKKHIVFQSTSDEETDRIKTLLRVKDDHICEVTNIPSIPKDEVKHKKKNEGELTCCFFARVCRKKNLIYALQIMSNVRSNVKFNIYGKIEEEDYWAECENEIKKLPSNIVVEYKGAYKHENVFELMSENDVFLFPTFSENYGHVIAEALFSGMPVIISDQTPWTDVERYGCGYSLSLNDKEGFVSAIEKYAQLSDDAFEVIRRKAIIYVIEKSNLDDVKKDYQDMLGKTQDYAAY